MGTLANVGVASGTPLYGLAAGSVEDATKGIAFALRGDAASGALTHLPSRDANGLYTRSQSPDAKYLVETDPVLSNLGNFYGSSYFLNLAGIDTNAIAKRLGDDAYETKLVRDAIFAETGKRYLSDDVTADAAQMQRLMDNALAERTALGLSFGVGLSAEQIAALTHDIVWFEEVEIDGETVLAPRLYLARATTDNLETRSARIVATAANIQAAQVANSGLIATDGALNLAASGDVRNQGGALAAGTALSVTAGNDVLNLSGTMSGKTVAIEAGRDVVASTLVTTITEGGATDAIMHQQAAISGDNGVTVTAKRDIATAGARIASGADATLDAGRDVLLSAATATDSTNFTFRGGSASSQSTRNLGSTVEAAGNLSVTAQRDIALAGSTASAGKAARLDAGGNVLVTSVQDSESYQAAVSSKSGGLLGGGKRGFSESSSSTTTIGSAIAGGTDVTVTARGGDLAVQASKVAASTGSAALTASGSVQVTAGANSTAFSRKDETAGFMRSRMDKSSDSRTTTVASTVSAGKDVTLTAQTGDVAVQAADIAAGGSLTLSAARGGVQILTARDSTFHSEDHSSSSMVWQSQKGSGQIDETTRYAALTAGDGIAITAAKGVTAEIHTGGASLADTVAALAQQPQTAWIAQVAQRDDVTWKRVQEIHDAWDYKSQGLSGPASAVIAIAVAIATQGAGAGLLGAAMGGGALTGAGGAMASAAFTSIVTQASLSLINNQGNLGAALKDLGSSSALKSLASAVVTAGIISGVANSGALDGLTANAEAGSQLTTLEQVQNTAVNSLSKAIVNTAADVAISGKDLDEALRTQLLTAAAGVIGEVAANEIGDAYAKAKVDGIDPLEYGLHKALHAALGCGTTALSGASCGAGAVGGVAGAAVAEAFYDPADKVVELTKKVREGDLTKGEMAAQLLTWQNEGADLSRLAAAVAVFATGTKSGENVTAGAGAGENAARNNVLETALDLASLALSLAELKVAVEKGDKLDILLAGGSVAIDGVAVVVPFLPGGAGYILKIVHAGKNDKLAAKVFDEAGNEIAVLSKSTDIGKNTNAGTSVATSGSAGVAKAGEEAAQGAKVGGSLTTAESRQQLKELFDTNSPTNGITIGDRTYLHDNSSDGARIFDGVGDADVKLYFEKLTGQPLTSAEVKSTPKGTIYVVKTPDGNFNLRDFNTSNPDIKWTIDVPTQTSKTKYICEIKFK